MLVTRRAAATAHPTAARRCSHPPASAGPSCACLSGTPCLFSDMRPTKLLAVIAAARVAGVTHLIEEGRFGCLSALMYALHGFEVTSIEFLPLSGVSAALSALAPSVRLLDGDGRQLLPRLLLPPAEGGEGALDPARVGVIFDGEKRFGAYATWQKVKHRAAFAVFDDTNLGDGDEFVAMLERERATWWETTDMLFEVYRRAEVRASICGPERWMCCGHVSFAAMSDRRVDVAAGGAAQHSARAAAKRTQEGLRWNRQAW